MIDAIDRVITGLLVLVSPLWLPFWITGWAADKVRDFLEDKGIIQ